MALTPEGRVKAAVKKILASTPDCWFYMPVQNGMGVVGIPDVIACVRGKFLAIETKAPGKLANVTINQAHQITAINDAGGTAIVLDDVRGLAMMLTQL